MVKLFVIDVDGTMTDGGIYYDENGNEFKKFCTKDAAAYFALKQVGIKVMVLTGRECAATLRRIKELHIDILYQDIKDKKSFLCNYMYENKLTRDDVGYIGDDLNDLPSMSLCGFVATPKDGCKEVKEIANYISRVDAGHGAVRDIIENYLEGKNLWKKAISQVYGIGI